MAKDLKKSMGKGLGSLMQPTTKQADEPTAEQLLEEEAVLMAADEIIEKAEPQQYVVVGARKNGAGSPRKQTAEKKQGSSVTMGLRDGYTRSTIICNIETLAKMKEIAYLEREPIMDIVEDALAAYIAKYESKHGEVVPQAPKKRRR